MTTYRLFIRLGAAALALLIALVLYGFWYAAVEGKSGSAADLADQIAQKRTDSSRAALAKQQLDALATNQATVDQYFVSTNGVVPFLESLQETATYFGATLQVSSVSAVPGTPYGHLDLALKITGPFNAVMKTIGAIEYEPYETTISDVTVDTSQNAAAGTAAAWTATMDVSVGTAITPTSATPASPQAAPQPSTPDTSTPAQDTQATSTTTVTAKAV